MCAAQQVANLLLEKLQNMGSELIDTRTHLTELEKLQRNETIDTLTKLVEAENKVAHYQSCLEECEATIHSVQEMKSMRQEYDIVFLVFIHCVKKIKRKFRDLAEHCNTTQEGPRGAVTNAEAVQQDLTSKGESIRERLQMTEAELADIRNLERESSEHSVRLALGRDTLLDELKTACMQLVDAKREEDSYVKGSSSTLLTMRF
ncbi:hypothetical protein EV424DRAFT_1341497 [Suillus variegatus]|nr:hypothetical protein EV424DRAFT_1341497 [Suillus variegatus]